MYVLILLAITGLYWSCDNQAKANNKHYNTASAPTIQLDTTGDNILKRFVAPDGFNRPRGNAFTAFHQYIIQLPLKKWGSSALYYDGTAKNNPNVYLSVFRLPIGNKDLHQCADACMRLRADFLYQKKQFSKIKFNYLADNKPRYYLDFAKGDYSSVKYWQYLEQVFSYANTASLHAELPMVTSINNVKVGDILLEKKQPFGHAVMVVDMIENTSGKKLMLLAQSYMPAQEIQILKNPTNAALSPWYELEEGNIVTPEWTFNHTHWKTWD